MKKMLISSFMAGLILAASSGAFSADHDGMLVIPVDLYACTYKDGKDSEDLDKVIAKWNAWADKRNIDDYAAWTLTPYYYGPEQEFDVLWLGAGKDAVVLGRAQDDYLANNDGIAQDFDEVISCNAHTNMASINFKATPEGATPANSVLTFSDCSYDDGATFDALGEAMGKWSKHLSDAGSNAGVWHWYPVYGGGGEEFDFKWVEAFENFADLGADYESYGNGRGFETYREVLSDLVSCDSTRAYLAQSRRFVQLR